ncbi:MAG: TRAM domain-containing protein [Gemmatimonadetes bacterium]|nr:TRAM domain-containing protein [Gemmatimonadota bacterium]
MSVADAVAAGQRVVVHVRSLASNGAGVAELPDGRVVFVHRTAPGDDVEVAVERIHRRWAAGTLVGVETSSSQRETPPCPLYDSCGGCTLQHVGYATQLTWKGRFVADALARIGGVDVSVPEVQRSPLVWGYRNRVTFILRRLRGGRVVAGFHALERPDRVVEVRDECLLAERPILQAWSGLREAWGRAAERLPAPGDLRITLRSVDGGVVVLVRGGAPGWEPGDLLERIPGCRALWHQPQGGPALLVAGTPAEEVVGAERVPLGGRAFVQVNREAADELGRHVLDRALAGAAGTLRAVDAFCGVGVHGRALARAGWRVQGIESDAEACAAARHGAPAGFSVVEGRVEERLSACLPADLVIVNPPRTGLDERVPPMLAAVPAPRLIYVSCDPATLARDAARLADTYVLADVRCFDLFPQTAHVETVAIFTRRGDPGEKA